MTKLECFNIGLFEIESKNISLANLSLYDKKVFELKCENFFHANPVTIAADPFLFVHNDELFLFYEELRFCTQGVIKMVKTKDLKNWSEPIAVLQESFHLSYPYVFEDNGVVYMIPETSASGEIRLYKAKGDGLTSFVLDCTLISDDNKGESIDIDFSDSSVYKKDGLYYLMTTRRVTGTYTLYLYVSDDLRGPYRVHPMSPVRISNKYGRNAGCLMRNNGILCRVAQDCEKRYGDNVHLFEVLKMDENDYQEKLVKENLFDTTTSFHKDGGHQFNMVQFLGKTIVATDAKEYKNYWLYRIVTKVLRILC